MSEVAEVVLEESEEVRVELVGVGVEAGVDVAFNQLKVDRFRNERKVVRMLFLRWKDVEVSRQQFSAGVCKLKKNPLTLNQKFVLFRNCLMD